MALGDALAGHGLEPAANSASERGVSASLLVRAYHSGDSRPDRLFDFPRRNPQMWAMVMVFYPLLSVVPQEFVYRSFFFRRYAALFPNPNTMIAVNALSFAAMHFVLQNWVAPLLSLIGGAIFAYGYQQHRSLKWVALEHALYGCMIFTVGLGWFFFRGFAPPP